MASTIMQPAPIAQFSFPTEWTDVDTEMMDVVCDEEISLTSNQEATKVFEQWQSDDDDDDDDDAVVTAENNTNRGRYVATFSRGVLHSEDDLAIMEVDEQIGNNLLGDEVFGGIVGGGVCGSFSPTTPFEELFATESHRFFAPLVDQDQEGAAMVDATGLIPHTTVGPSSLVEDATYQEVIKKLEESMKRSQETRKSLTMKTNKTEKYDRTKSVTGVLSSIENSSRQLQTYLHTIQRTI